jgi:hypothetical protein
VRAQGEHLDLTAPQHCPFLFRALVQRLFDQHAITALRLAEVGVEPPLVARVDVGQPFQARPHLGERILQRGLVPGIALGVAQRGAGNERATGTPVRRAVAQHAGGDDFVER